jgi:tungstate transport system permease protein
MDYLLHALRAALALIASGDPETWAIVGASLRISLAACLLAAVVGIPLGLGVALRSFRGKNAVQVLLNTLMALPTVVVGLFVYGLISRRGPLGEAGLLFTPGGVVIGEFLLATPIIANLTLAAVRALDPRVVTTCRTLGAGPVQEAGMVLREGWHGVVGAVVAGFGRVIAEVGVAMMLGGNIRGLTRTMTTAIALETSKGEFELGLALGLLLLAVAFGVNAALFALQERGR